MRKLLLALIAVILLLLGASSVWAADQPAVPKGVEMHHPLDISGGTPKGIQPDSATVGDAYVPAQIEQA